MSDALRHSALDQVLTATERHLKAIAAERMFDEPGGPSRAYNCTETPEYRVVRVERESAEAALAEIVKVWRAP